MKKLVLACLVSLMLFVACGDLFIDVAQVHNGLIQKMDFVVTKEDDFYDSYNNFYEAAAFPKVKENFENLKEALDALDVYFEETRFSKKQKLFVEEYNDYYKPFVQEYLTEISELILKAEESGFQIEVLDPYFNTVDALVIRFANIHTRLVDTINLQADVAVSAS